MPTNEEKTAFSKRLKIALLRSSEPVKGATELALRFNLRYEGDAISAQTAHKWLTGRAIPMQDKLKTLANWLDVDEHRLHYGPPPTKDSPSGKEVKAKATNKPSQKAIDLALRVQNLSEDRQYLIEALIEQLQPNAE